MGLPALSKTRPKLLILLVRPKRVFSLFGGPPRPMETP